MALPAARPRFLRYVRELSPLAGNDPARAACLSKTVLHLWQREVYPQLLADWRLPAGGTGLSSDRAVLDFASWLARQNFSDASYWLATAYAQWVSHDVRAARSMYFTPPILAERVLDRLCAAGASLDKGVWYDPASGGAAFLVPSALRIAKHLSTTGLSPKQILVSLERRLRGTDLDENLVFMSQQFLRMALYLQIEQSSYLPKFNLQCGDGLARNTGAFADVVICNPPYRKLSAAEARSYARDFSDIIEGQSNVYALFILQSLRAVRRTGAVGLLTPTSYLSGKHFSKLRSLILRMSKLVSLDMLSDRRATFMQVEQETAIAVLSKAVPSEISTRVSVLTSAGELRQAGDCKFRPDGGPWPIPRNLNASELLDVAASSSFRLSQYGYTARIGHLVAYRDARARRIALPQGKGRHTVRPLVWATDISPGNFKHGRSASPQRKPFVVCGPNPKGLVSSASIVVQRVTSTDQPRRLVCAAIPADWIRQHSGFVAENHVIVLERTDEKGWAPELLASILNSKAVDHIYRARSGASNVSIFELSEMPLPAPELLLSALSRCADFELAIVEGYAATKRLSLDSAEEIGRISARQGTR